MRRLTTLPWLIGITVPLSTFPASWTARCTSIPIKVGLHASFPSPPFLLELLETAAQENATAYFPILDRIADGHFSNCQSDKELYDKFVRLLKDDEHLLSAESLSTFDLALSIHSAAPRIEAQYQYYESTVKPALTGVNISEPANWIGLADKQSFDGNENNGLFSMPVGSRKTLPFDRVRNKDLSRDYNVLYADINSPSFSKYYEEIKNNPSIQTSTYGIRHKPNDPARKGSLPMAGFGVELALKRTDYIVIDDRNASPEPSIEAESSSEVDEENNLKPLTATELRDLGEKTASYVMAGEDSLQRLLEVLGNFPKYSSEIAAQEVSQDLKSEHKANRESFLPKGYNVIWMNGLQVDPREVDAFNLVDNIRRERAIIHRMLELGFSATEAIALLSQPVIAQSIAQDKPQRYNFVDNVEGGKVIIWMNNIEKDKRYSQWPTQIEALLQRAYPGQLPTVRRDIHNVVLPIDFTDIKDVMLVIDTVQSFVKRVVPVRFGIVPVIKSAETSRQAKIVYHIVESYGLALAMEYLQNSMAAKSLALSDQKAFELVVGDKEPKADLPKLSFQEILQDEQAEVRIDAVKQYLLRLGLMDEPPSFLVNGIYLARDDDWLQVMSSRITTDLRYIQRLVYDQVALQEAWLPIYLLDGAAQRRNPLLIPDSPKSAEFIDVTKLPSDVAELCNKCTRLRAEKKQDDAHWSQLIVMADFTAREGLQLAQEAINLHRDNRDIEITIVPKPKELWDQDLEEYVRMATQNVTRVIEEDLSLSGSFEPMADSSKCAKAAKILSSYAQLSKYTSQDMAVIYNGRLIGPISVGHNVTKADLKLLVDYEFHARTQVVAEALKALDFQDKIQSAKDFATLSSLVAISSTTDVPEGIFETPPLVRNQLFNDWQAKHTLISSGDIEKSSVQIVASIDPASELAQEWVPILKILFKLSGVHGRIFLNPKDKLEELPIKRFYRYVLDSKPKFAENGQMVGPEAHFSDLPATAILSTSLNVPSSWLVAPKECVQDLDNIKLDTYHGQSSVDAIYELESILIEGHSREMPSGVPPRGVQLVLEALDKSKGSDTIIMANLGYFQFKANPGIYKLRLKEGRSTDIYNIDSIGSEGFNVESTDGKPLRAKANSLVSGEATGFGLQDRDVSMITFKGLTLYPRLSRKAGKEEENVLDPSSNIIVEFARQGVHLVDRFLHKAGLDVIKDNEYITEAWNYGSIIISKMGSKFGTINIKQADINIFSVASGHLYERMLNIMMVSVMRHTNHTVKFWFIEQFLSPSFKQFLPEMAAEYGFTYEMVTYKWPHWLRAQKEKQREIWGYKILFLDVLFPLDLDKVIFVDADQIVRTDMYELVSYDLQGAPYGFTPMCDSRTEMEDFRFWKQGYWKNLLGSIPYHISALFVVDLKRFRQIAAGDRLRQNYHQLSADPESLSNLDQDLPNSMQMAIPIHSLPQEWLWCETWCSDESLKDARTIDLCNNPQTKEPKLDRARRQVPEWTIYDDEIAALAKRVEMRDASGEQAQKVQANDENTLSSGTVKGEQIPSASAPLRDEL